MAKILIVEDDALIADDLIYCLKKAGHTITAHEISGVKALNHFKVDSPDLVLMDIRLADQIDGIETAAIIKARKNIPVIYITAYSNENYQKRAERTSPASYLLKPFNEKELLDAISKALAGK